MGRRKWIAIGIVVTVAVSLSLIAGREFYEQRAVWTGLSINNQTDRAMDFLIVSDFNGGLLHVAQNSVGSLEIARGPSAASSYHATISLSGTGTLFDGILRPGVDCDAVFIWNGTALVLEPYKICA